MCKRRIWRPCDYESSSPFALPFARFATPSNTPSASANLLSLFFFFPPLAVLSRVLLCKLLSDRDNQINRFKRSNKVNRTTDLVRPSSLSFSLFASASSGKKNKFAWTTCFGIDFASFLIISCRTSRWFGVLFRVCTALRSGFSNDRESRITM